MLLHNNYMMLRQLSHVSKANFASVVPGSVDSKVKFTSHSPSVFEFKLNAPKSLNSLDNEMCDIMLRKLQTWFKEP